MLLFFSKNGILIRAVERKSVGYLYPLFMRRLCDNVCPYAHIVYRAAQPAFHVQRIQVFAPYNRVIKYI